MYKNVKRPKTLLLKKWEYIKKVIPAVAEEALGVEVSGNPGRHAMQYCLKWKGKIQNRVTTKRRNVVYV